MAVLAAGCHSGGDFLAPASPEAAVRSFLNAVKANSMTAMSDLWGSEQGPASHWMKDRQAMEQKLTIMRIYLEHEKFDLLPPNDALTQANGKRRVDVRIYRRGCSPVVPFTVIRAGTGWLVWDIDLSAAGNPALPCRPASSGR